VPQRLEGRQEIHLALHERLLGDLDDQPLKALRTAATRRFDERARPRIQQDGRGKVHRDARAGRPALEQLEGRGQAGPLQRRTLAQLLGQREPAERPVLDRRIAEARQRLVGVRCPTGDLHDRLHDHLEPIPRDQARDRFARPDKAVVAERRHTCVALRRLGCVVALCTSAALGHARGDVAREQQRLGAVCLQARPAQQVVELAREASAGQQQAGAGYAQRAIFAV